jgi:hypothetical protein
MRIELNPTRSLFACAVVLAWALHPSGARAQEAGAVRLRCGVQIHATEASGFLLFPQDETFCPPIADPKQPRSFLAFQRGKFGTLDVPGAEATSIGAIGLADAFGLARWGGSRPGDGFHLAVAGGIFAQFDLGTPSSDLINADYMVGLPLTWRRAWFSTHIRLYHQSSHLGDEYVLRSTEIQRANLSYESLEMLLSAEAGPMRFYGGGEFLLRREPDTLERSLAHAGLELRTGSAGPLSMLAGVDVKCSEQQDWRRAISARAGVQIAPGARSGHPLRRVLLLAEYYDGPRPTASSSSTKSVTAASASTFCTDTSRRRDP